jgi:hypothetical protein
MDWPEVLKALGEVGYDGWPTAAPPPLWRLFLCGDILALNPARLRAGN